MRVANTVPDLPSGRDGVRPDPAGRLAELIRRDPTLLTDGDHPRLPRAGGDAGG